MNYLLINLVIALWFTFFTTFLLAIFVYVKNRKGKINRIFAFYSFSIAWWSFCEIWWVTTLDRTISLFWCRLAEVGVFFIPTFFIHFVCTFFNIQRRKILLRIAYTLSIFFASISFGNLLILDMVPKFFVRYWAVPGIVYPFAVAFFVICVVYVSKKGYFSPKVLTPCKNLIPSPLWL